MTVKFYANYMDTHGRVSWDDFKEHLDQAVSHCFPVLGKCVPGIGNTGKRFPGTGKTVVSPGRGNDFSIINV